MGALSDAYADAYARHYAMAKERADRAGRSPRARSMSDADYHFYVAQAAKALGRLGWPESGWEHRAGIVGMLDGSHAAYLSNIRVRVLFAESVGILDGSYAAYRGSDAEKGRFA